MWNKLEYCAVDRDLTTSRKLWLGFGTLTLLLMLAVVAIILRLQTVEDQVTAMADARARAMSARELEIDALDFALNVRQYLETGEHAARAAMEADAAAVEISRVEYGRLATTDSQRQLASRVDVLWTRFKSLGETLASAPNRLPGREDLARFTDLRLQLERMLDTEVKADGDSEYHARRESTLADVRNVEFFTFITLLVGAGVGLVTSVVVGRGVIGAERVVWENRELLRVTLASIGDAVITTDTEGRVISMNSVAETLTGWRNDEAKGSTLTDVFRIVNEESRQPVDNPAMRALKDGVVVRLANHTLLIAKDGFERHIDDSAAPIRDESGTMLGAVLIFRDISERRQIERAGRESDARKAAVLETALDCIITMDQSGNIIDFNPAAERTFGYRREDVVGREMAGFIIPASLRERHRQGLARYLTTGEGPVLGTRLELTALRADGSEFPVELAIARIGVSGPAMFTGYLRDITERKDMENQLRQLVADMSETVRRKDEFLAMLAHELRNPLAPIRSAVAVLRQSTPLEPASGTVTEMMERQIGQLVRLIDDLMDVSRISRGKIELQSRPLEVASVVHQAVEASRPLIKDNGLDLTVTMPPAPMYVNADPTRLAQVIGNLLNNAAKFTPKGGHVWLSVERDQDQAIIRVRDSGVGIAAQDLPRIFDMFIQVDTSLERARGGLGIGLTLARSLVELHEGTIVVHSAGPGSGSEFVVCLPVLAESPPLLSTQTSQEGVTPGAMRRRILVVDDNQDAAEALALLLDHHGHEVRMAHDGLEAVEAAAAFMPDVVLLDIGLPKLNGYEAARRIRSLRGGDPLLLIALTGWGQDADRRRSAEAGFDVHLVKPVDHLTLSRTIANWPPAKA